MADYGAQTVYRLSGGAAGATPVPFATLGGSPTALAFDSGGNLFVSLRNPAVPGGASGRGEIDRVAPDGRVSVFAAGLDSPAGLLFDGAGNLLAADQYAHVIYSFTPAGDRRVFYASATNTSYFGLAFNPGADHLFASGSFGVERFTLTGVKDPTSYALGEGPLGIAFDAAGILYGAQGGGGITGYPGPNAVPFLFAGGLDAPEGLAFDPTGAGTLYEADSGSGRVLAFDLQGNRTVVAGGLDQPYAVAVAADAVPEPGAGTLAGVGGALALTLRHGMKGRRRGGPGGSRTMPAS